MNEEKKDANKSNVENQSTPEGDRFISTTSDEKLSSVTEAPMDIYPKDGRDRSESKPAHILDAPMTERDARALAQSSSFSAADVQRAARVLRSNPIVTPDGPVGEDGRPLQEKHAEGEESTAAVPSKEFDRNSIREGSTPVGDARGQEGAEAEVAETFPRFQEAAEVKAERKAELIENQIAVADKVETFTRGGAIEEEDTRTAREKFEALKRE